ncbi:MAG: hypothetical protein RLN70_09945, partial [Rhodospirillaceae bacterium]
LRVPAGRPEGSYNLRIAATVAYQIFCHWRKCTRGPRFRREAVPLLFARRLARRQVLSYYGLPETY